MRGRPIALSRIDVHASWVSHSVLNQMGELPREVDGGVIMRDDNGKPTGIRNTFSSFSHRLNPTCCYTGVFVDNAMSLVPVPPWSEAQRLAYFEIAMHDALSVGLTSVHDAASSPEAIQFFQRYRSLPSVLALFNWAILLQSRRRGETPGSFYPLSFFA